MKLYDQIWGKIQNIIFVFSSIESNIDLNLIHKQQFFFHNGEEVEKMLNLQYFCLFKRLSQNPVLAWLITNKS